VAGYEAAIRTGEFLGAEHYKIFHTTGTAGTMGAAAGVGHLLGLDSHSMLNALGSAGTQAAGLWEFLRDEADSKVLHSAKAAANGLLSAYTARDGLTGASRILEGKQGLGAGLSSKTDPAKITDRLGTRWATLECTYKPYACCRHAHPAADALMVVIRENNLKADDIAHVTAFVHQRAMGVLGEVRNPQTVRQAKFCMGFVLALIATYGRAGIDDFSETTLRDPKLRDFERRVEMVVDPTIPGQILERPGRVEVTTIDGRRLEGRVIAAKGDPSNTLSHEELEVKTQQLAAYGSAATPDEVRRIIAAAWKLHELPNLDPLFLGR
jgi:2-methylcitrate dehydratase PrpD